MTTASATATVITPAARAAFVRAAGLRTGMPPEAADTLADAALGQIGCTMAMWVAVAKAKQVGVAAVSLRNTGHIGAACGYALLAGVMGVGAVVSQVRSWMQDPPA